MRIGPRTFRTRQNSRAFGRRCLAGVLLGSLAMILLCLTAGQPVRAQDGPHADAYMVPHIALNIEYSTSISDYAGLSNVRGCEDIAVSAPVPDQENLVPVIWYVLALFEDSPGPVDVCGLAFGLDNYDSASFEIFKWGSCFPTDHLELFTSGWPGPNEGVAVVNSEVGGRLARDLVVELYWFVSYVYAEVEVGIGDHPNSIAVPGGVEIGDCTVPSTIDAVEEYNRGRMGFGREGRNPCVSLPATGACCVAEECVILSLPDCDSAGGSYIGDNTTCFPINPCEPPQATSWGNLKRLYNN